MNVVGTRTRVRWFLLNRITSPPKSGTYSVSSVVRRKKEKKLATVKVGHFLSNAPVKNSDGHVNLQGSALTFSKFLKSSCNRMYTPVPSEILRFLTCFFFYRIQVSKTRN